LHSRDEMTKAPCAVEWSGILCDLRFALAKRRITTPIMVRIRQEGGLDTGVVDCKRIVIGPSEMTQFSGTSNHPPPSLALILINLAARSVIFPKSSNGANGSL
jgi:hypothetical protein